MRFAGQAVTDGGPRAGARTGAGPPPRLRDTLLTQERLEAVATAQARFDRAGQEARIAGLEKDRRIQALAAERLLPAVTRHALMLIFREALHNVAAAGGQRRR